MTTAVQRRRGTTSQHSTFTGLEGEITVDTTKDTIVVHDGSTAGGIPILREDFTNGKVSGLGSINGADTANDDQFLIFDTSTSSFKKISRAELNNAIEQDPIAVLTVAAGTVSAPSITTTGDTNTGIFFPAADTIAFTEGGVESMRINSSGDVGIGTSAPVGRLHLNAPSGNTVLQLTNATGQNSTNGISLIVAAGGEASIYQRENNYLRFGTNNAERMRLHASGGLSLGDTTDPGAGSLRVAGNATLGDASTDTVTVNGYMGVGVAPNSGIGVLISNTALTGTTQRGMVSNFTATSSATSVVAGFQSSPGTAAASFTVADVIGVRAANVTKGAGSTITNQHGVYIDEQNQGTNNYGLTMLVTSGTNKWNIYASGTANNYFAGNVGIGTSSVGTRLHVAGAAEAVRLQQDSAYISFYNTAGTRRGYIQVAEAESRIWGEANTPMLFATNNAERMRIDSAGNLGLGVTPSAWGSEHAAFQIGFSGAIQSYKAGTASEFTNYLSNAYNDNTNWRYIRDGAATRYQQTESVHQWFTAASGTAGNAISFTQAMTLDASGNLGVGLTSISAIGSSRILEIGASTGNSSFLLFNVNSARTGSVYSNASETSIGSIPATPLLFKTTDVERMRITSAGNLGVGTAAPVNKLQVSGSFGRGTPVTKTGNFTLADTENWLICNGTGTITVTLPAASSWTGREFTIKTIAAFTVVSASTNVVPLAGGSAGTAILAATAGAWATLVSDGTNWIIMQA